MEYQPGIPDYQMQLKEDKGRGWGKVLQLLIYQFAIARWLLTNSKKYDVIHVFDLDAGLPVMFVARLKKMKYVYHIADFYVASRPVPPRLQGFVRRLEYRVIGQAYATIVCNEERKEQIEGSKPKKLVVIHNTPALEVKVEYEPNHGQLMLGYVGILSASRFIRTAVDVLKDYPDLRLSLAGMGSLEGYIDKVSNEHNNIHFFGMIDYESALELYAKCDLMFALYDPAIPNHRYSAPNKVYEAMLLGKPIIVAEGTGVDKLVQRHEMGFVIEYSRDGFVRVLETIRQDPSCLKKLGENAKQAGKFYSWGVMKQRLAELYNDFVEEMR
jgi:glycosyltransferase involved in cell wall biosynthesis